MKTIKHYLKQVALITGARVMEKPISLKSTPCQDRKMVEMLREEAKHQPFYNFFAHQCVFWSVGALQYGMDTKCSDCCQK